MTLAFFEDFLHLRRIHLGPFTLQEFSGQNSGPHVSNQLHAYAQWVEMHYRQFQILYGSAPKINVYLYANIQITVFGVPTV